MRVKGKLQVVARQLSVNLKVNVKKVSVMRRFQNGRVSVSMRVRVSKCCGEV